jgi:electron transport complex protein RnfB
MHTVVAELCTGCDLCVPPCPVDCISMQPVTGEATGWDAWSQPQADAARERHERRDARLAQEREAAEARVAARRSSAGAVGAPSASAPPAGASASASAPAAATSPAPATDDAEAKKRAIIQAALERARKRKEELAAKGQAPLNTEHVSADVQAQIDAAEARRRRLGLADNDSANNADTDTAAANTPPTPAATRNPR